MKAAWEYFLICMVVLLLLAALFARCRFQRSPTSGTELEEAVPPSDSQPRDRHSPPFSVAQHQPHSLRPVLSLSAIDTSFSAFVFHAEHQGVLSATPVKHEKNLHDLFAQHCYLTCIICLDEFVDQVSVIRQLPCQHIFHASCIDRWLTTCHAVCPLCKTSYPTREDSSPSTAASMPPVGLHGNYDFL